MAHGVLPAAADIRKLKAFILEKAPTCIHQPEGRLPHAFVTPSYEVDAGADDRAAVPLRSLFGHYLQMYDWDACFFSQAAHRLAVRGLASAVIANFLSFRGSDGYVPRTVSPQRVWDMGDLCKPFLAQSLLHERTTENRAGATAGREVIEDLDRYYGYFQRHRRNRLGLYHWRNALESGVDDNLALLYPREAAVSEKHAGSAFLDDRLLAADLNSYLVAEFRAFARLCQMAGLGELGERYSNRAEEIQEGVEQLLWNEEFGLYLNFDPESSQYVKVRAWTGLCPILMGISSAERVEQVIRRNLLSKEHFLRPAGLASLAASEPLYNQSKRGLYGRAIVSNWQGPLWILPNALAVRCLQRYGFKSEAQDIALRVISTMAAGLEARGTLFENYDAETGKALWAPQFMSWNVLALELIEMLE